MGKGKSDKPPAATLATTATPSFKNAVAMTKEQLSHIKIDEIRGLTRQLMAQNLANAAEAQSLKGGWIGNRKFIAVKVRDGSYDISQLVEAAEWHPLAFEAAGILSARFVEKGEPMPDALRLWAVEALKGKQAPPMPRNQRKGIKNEDWWHKFYVWSAVSDLVELGMKPTRNAASEPCSACDAVAAAMREKGLNPMSYSGVYEVWKTYNALK